MFIITEIITISMFHIVLQNVNRIENLTVVRGKKLSSETCFVLRVEKREGVKIVHLVKDPDS